MNLRSHVKITVSVLEKHDQWKKYFKVEDLNRIVEEIHSAADWLVRDVKHHPNGAVLKKAFYHIMRARHFWVLLTEGKINAEDDLTFRGFFESLILAMHLYQDAVIEFADQKEHDFIEKKIGEIIDSNEIQMKEYDPNFARKILKRTGFVSGVRIFVDPFKCYQDAVAWTQLIAIAVMSERVVDSASAERYLLERGVMRVKEEEDKKLGEPIRNAINQKLRSVDRICSNLAKLAFIHVFVFFLVSSIVYRKTVEIPSVFTPLVYIYLNLFWVWVALVFVPFAIKPLWKKQIMKKAEKEIKKSKIYDLYPSHAFFDAPHIFIEYNDSAYSLPSGSAHSAS